jgi:hypothetical protein
MRYRRLSCRDCHPPRANRLGRPTPDFNIDYEEEDETWEHGYTGAYLSRAAQSDLRRLIRQEEKEHRDALAFWVKDVLAPALSVVIYILGLTTGLIALLRK